MKERNALQFAVVLPWMNNLVSSGLNDHRSRKISIFRVSCFPVFSEMFASRFYSMGAHKLIRTLSVAAVSSSQLSVSHSSHVSHLFSSLSLLFLFSALIFAFLFSLSSFHVPISFHSLLSLFSILSFFVFISKTSSCLPLHARTWHEEDAESSWNESMKLVFCSPKTFFPVVSVCLAFCWYYLHGYGRWSCVQQEGSSASRDCWCSQHAWFWTKRSRCADQSTRFHFRERWYQGHSHQQEASAWLYCSSQGVIISHRSLSVFVCLLFRSLHFILLTMCHLLFRLKMRTMYVGLLSRSSDTLAGALTRLVIESSWCFWLSHRLQWFAYRKSWKPIQHELIVSSLEAMIMRYVLLLFESPSRLVTHLPSCLMCAILALRSSLLSFVCRLHLLLVMRFSLPLFNFVGYSCICVAFQAEVGATRTTSNQEIWFARNYMVCLLSSSAFPTSRLPSLLFIWTAVLVFVFLSLCATSWCMPQQRRFRRSISFRFGSMTNNCSVSKQWNQSMRSSLLASPQAHFIHRADRKKNSAPFPFVFLNCLVCSPSSLSVLYCPPLPFPSFAFLPSLLCSSRIFGGLSDGLLRQAAHPSQASRACPALLLTGPQTRWQIQSNAEGFQRTWRLGRDREWTMRRRRVSGVTN